METANKVIVTLILCFIFLSLFMTYLAVLVRALRIKNATLKNRLETADKDVKDAYDSLDNVKAEFDLFRTQSAKILNTSTENNSRLQIELNKAKEDNAKLFDIAKGAVAKLAEINTEVDRIVGEKDSSNEDTFKIGDWVKGRTRATGILLQGEIVEFHSDGNPRIVSGTYLELSTCKKINP